MMNWMKYILHLVAFSYKDQIYNFLLAPHENSYLDRELFKPMLSCNISYTITNELHFIHKKLESKQKSHVLLTLLNAPLYRFRVCTFPVCPI